MIFIPIGSSIFREAGSHGSNIPKLVFPPTGEWLLYLLTCLFIFIKASRYQSHNHRSSEKLRSHILSPDHTVIKSVLQRKHSKYFKNCASENQAQAILEVCLLTLIFVPGCFYILRMLVCEDPEDNWCQKNLSRLGCKSAELIKHVCILADSQKQRKKETHLVFCLYVCWFS